MQRDDQDRLVTMAFAPAGKHQDTVVPSGRLVVGFGPWPTWSSNVHNGVATLPDEDSGLFEPERLFVLREQYAFVAAADAAHKPISLGPIHKVWWAGTENVVQARQREARH
jgi:hypothetical protein